MNNYYTTQNMTTDTLATSNKWGSQGCARPFAQLAKSCAIITPVYPARVLVLCGAERSVGSRSKAVVPFKVWNVRVKR